MNKVLGKVCESRVNGSLDEKWISSKRDPFLSPTLEKNEEHRVKGSK